MRKVINSTYITLDGVIQNPQDWPALSSFTDDGPMIQSDLLRSCDAVLIGRHTYEAFAPVWMGRSGDPYTDHINAMTKYVVSTTLRDPQWENTTVIDSDPIDTIHRLKEQPGADIVQYGFGRLADELMEHGPSR
jgi:dihydrofolate reductase